MILQFLKASTWDIFIFYEMTFSWLNFFGCNLHHRGASEWERMRKNLFDECHFLHSSLLSNVYIWIRHEQALPICKFIFLSFAFFFRSLICKIRKTCNLHKFAVDEKNCKWKKWNKNHVGRARDIFLSYKCTTFCCYFSLTHRWLLVSIADSLSCSRRCNWGIFLCKFSFLRNLQLNF